MNLWSTLVHNIAETFATVGAWVGGSTAAGILLLALVARCALIPIMAPIGARTRERMKIVRRIRPEIREINERFREDARGLSRELKALHERNGIKVIDGPGLIAALIQLPILIALFQATHEASAGTALAEGGLPFGVLAAALAVGGAVLSRQSDGAAWVLWISAILPVGIGTWLGKGIGLYLTGFYSGGLIQGLLTRAHEKTRRPGSPRSEPSAS